MKMDQVIGNSRAEAMPVKAESPKLSPHGIGREFVRCYYTLLHNHPNKLHRFYLEQSTFVHGNQAEEAAECVTGQRAIHDKIMSLNFEDCRTKIKHVDSQPTIHNGVVVQVSGELSNAGKLPRRFMQTFVLGSETPRKYYVHNDIFRYQDEVFGSEPEEEEDEEEEEGEEEGIMAEDETSLGSEPEDESREEVVEEAETNGTHEEPPFVPDEPEEEVPVEEALNELEAAAEPVTEASPIAPEEEAAVQEEEAVEPEPAAPAPEETIPVEEAPAEPAPAEEPVEEAPPAPKGPISWAAVASSGTFSSTPTTPPKPAKPAPPEATPVIREHVTREHPIKKETPFQPFSKEDRGEKPRRKATSWEKGPGSGPGGGGIKQEAPNSQQIFVGNLPHKTADAELREVFGYHGNVIGVRVTPNNFGFVIFDREEPVVEILAGVRRGKVYTLREQRLNVEEKKVAVGGSRAPRKQFTSEPRGGTRHMGGRRRGGGGGGRYGGDSGDYK